MYIYRSESGGVDLYKVMERWKGWMWFYFKSSFFLPTKCILVKVASCHKHKAEEKGHGLVSLYKDIEDCEGYEDIQVMWEIIHSSRAPNGSDNKNRKKPAHLRFCFRPT